MKNKSFGIDDSSSDLFADYMHKYPELYEEFAGIVVDKIKKKNPVILDVGMGPGLLSSAIYRKFPDSFIIGLDPVEQMVRLAYEENQNSISVIQGISEHLPFCSKTVDVAVSRFSLPYWSDPQRGINEIFRVLKRDGLVYFDVLNKDFSKVRLGLIKIHMYLRGASGVVIRYHIDSYKIAYDFKEVVTFMNKAGFSIVTPDDAGNNWHYVIIASK